MFSVFVYLSALTYRNVSPKTDDPSISEDLQLLAQNPLDVFKARSTLPRFMFQERARSQPQSKAGKLVCVSNVRDDTTAG
jgi:hypothetical protein